jgi:hypothetical protein
MTVYAYWTEPMFRRCSITMSNAAWGERHKILSNDREGVVHKIELLESGTDGYIIANTREDGSLYEVFLQGFGKTGSSQYGWTQVTAICLSLLWQYGAQLPVVVRKLAMMKFEPYGATSNPEIPYCHSVPHYIGVWLAQTFGDETLVQELKELTGAMR